MFLLPFLSSCSSYPVPLFQSSHFSPFPGILFLFLSSLCSASCSSSFFSHLIPLILFLSYSHLIVPFFSVTLFLSFSSLSSASCSSSLSPHLFPLIVFLSSSHLTVPLILLLCFFSCPLLVSLHVPLPFPLSCSSYLFPLILFLFLSHLLVPLFLFLCFFPCPLLVLLHAPLPFPLILFLLSSSSLPVISLFPYSVSFLVLS
jgi:hypothetical protein